MGPSKPSRSSRRRDHRSNRPRLEPLECRQLFTAELLSVIGPQLAHPATPAQDTIDLSTRVVDSNGPGTIAHFHTTQGDFDIALSDNVTPITVANFLHYVNSGELNHTIFSRSVPGFVEQLGGYSINRLGAHIPVQPPIPTEFNTANPVHNVRGTVAMALSGGSNNTAQSEWFVNLADNSANLDTQSGGFTVFGNVIGNGMSVLDKIAALPTASIAKNTGNGALTDVPLQGYNSTRKPAAPIFFGNLVQVISATSRPAMTYTVSSDNPSLVQPILNGRSVTFSYRAGGSGVANITVTGTSTTDGSTVNTTFAVTVPTASGGLQANPDTPTNVFLNTPAHLQPLANDTDSASAINPATLIITTQPAHGTAVVDTTTGTITYTPVANYTGPDTLQYTVRDLANTASTPTAVSFTVGAAPVTTTVGTATVRTMTWHEPDGTTAHLSIAGGTAIVTFASSDVQTTLSGTDVTVTGTGATVTGITITNTAKREATLTITASGGSDGLATVGGIQDSGPVASIIAPAVNLTGALNVASLAALTLGNSTGALITFGAGRVPTVVSINTATDTSIVTTGTISSLRTKRWASTDGIADTISSSSIGTLSAAGEFAATLQLGSTSMALRSASVGGSLTGGAWSVTGSVGNLTAASAAVTWALVAGDSIGNVHIKADLPGAITARYGMGSLVVGGNHSAALNISSGSVSAIRVGGGETGDVTATHIGTFTVGGDLADTILANSPVAKGVNNIGLLNVRGAINNTIINSTGSIGTIIANRLVGSQVYANIAPGPIAANALPAIASDAGAGQINLVRLGAGSAANPSFSNSKISANTITTEILGVVQNDNAGAPEGTAAVKFGSIHATLVSGGTLNLGHAQLKDAASLSSFFDKAKITPKDFAINILV